MTQSPSHYNIVGSLSPPRPLVSLVPLLAPPPPRRATHSAAQLRSPLRRSLPQAQVFRRAPRPASGAHKFNAKVKAATTRNRVGRVVSIQRAILVLVRSRGGEATRAARSFVPCASGVSLSAYAPLGSSSMTARVNRVAFTFRFPYLASHRPGASRRPSRLSSMRSLMWRMPMCSLVGFVSRKPGFVRAASKCSSTSFAGATDYARMCVDVSTTTTTNERTF